MRPAAPGPRVSAAARRAKEMMIGGLLLGHACGVVVMGLAAVLGGADAFLTAALGFAAVVVFFAVGQWLEVVACELEPVQGMGLALASYAVRVAGITVGMWAITTAPALAPHISSGWLVASVTLTVIGWIGGVVWVASRQQVPVYDEEYSPPAREGDEPPGNFR